MNDGKITLEEAALLLSEADDILIISHAHPDGDTLGSARALSLHLERLGKRTACVCEDKAPYDLDFIFGEGRLYSPDELEELPFSPRFIVTADVASRELMGKTLSLRYGDSVDLRIDHHAGNEGIAKAEYVDPHAAAVGEIIYALCAHLPCEASASSDALEANAEYTAIATDTGCFKYSNVTSDTFYTAAKLLEAGADAHGINSAIFESRSKEELAAIKLTLDNIKYLRGGTLAYILVTEEMKKAYGITDEDMHVISAFIKEIGGVELGIVIREDGTELRKYKISMRSRNFTDVRALCALMGGGGHIRAAGASVYADSKEEAEEKIISTVMRALDDGSAS